jgi:hypothetical protein
VTVAIYNLVKSAHDIYVFVHVSDIEDNIYLVGANHNLANWPLRCHRWGIRWCQFPSMLSPQPCGTQSCSDCCDHQSWWCVTWSHYRWTKMLHLSGHCLFVFDKNGSIVSESIDNSNLIDLISILFWLDNFRFSHAPMQKTKIVTSFVHWQWWIFMVMLQSTVKTRL